MLLEMELGVSEIYWVISLFEGEEKEAGVGQVSFG